MFLEEKTSFYFGKVLIMILIVYCDINLSFIFRQFPSSQNCRIQTYSYKRFTSLFYTTIHGLKELQKSKTFQNMGFYCFLYSCPGSQNGRNQTCQYREFYCFYTTVHGLTELQKSDLPILRVILFLILLSMGSQNCRNQTCQY